VNTSVKSINLEGNEIAAEGASALADALKSNTSVTSINLNFNAIGDKGASALADALKVNTSVTRIHLYGNTIGADHLSNINELVARNARLRRLFLFDARRMLLSLMCADECGCVWPYLLERDDTDGIVAPDNIEKIRAELAAVVEERRRRDLCRPVRVADVRALRRETHNQIASFNDTVSGQASQISEHTNQNAEQTNQIAEQTIQIAEQTNQIADLLRSTATIVEQNQQMQEQMRQMHALLSSLSREQESSAERWT
jgi:hypothetical protein